MHRLTAVLVATAASTALLVTPALAAGEAAPRPAKAPAAAPKKAPAPKPAPQHAYVTFAGVVSDTPTVGVGSDTSTSTIRLSVKDSTRRSTTVAFTVDRDTVLRRGERPASVSDVRAGDHASVKAVREKNGVWRALRVNVSPRQR